MNKKIAILLVLAMSASLACAGCSGNKPEETTAATTTTAVTEASATDTSKEETQKSETSEDKSGETKDESSDSKPSTDEKDPKAADPADDNDVVVIDDPDSTDDNDDDDLGKPVIEPGSTDGKSSNDDYYSANTALGKAEVEKFCAMIRDAYLDSDWETLSKYARYPAKVNGQELKDADAYLKYLKGKKASADSIKAMKEESCKDMMFTGQGICLASGLIWIIDDSYLTDKEPKLQVFSMCGIE